MVLAMTRAFPGVPLYTSLYDPPGTFPEFQDLDVRTASLNTIPGLRHHHRAALPVLAAAFSRLQIDAAVTVCSSSGWAHGVSVTGQKVVYCHTPARWLYQSDRYLGRPAEAAGAKRRAKRAALAMLGPRLKRWDLRAARSADRYLANSAVVAEAIREIYGIEAEILAPPPALAATGSLDPVAGLEPGFWLCVSRLLPYKNVDAILEAARLRGDRRLVVVGDGPERSRLAALGGRDTSFLGKISDAQLRWCYANCRALVAASYEDFGLTPLEAAAFGRPSVVLRAGGFLDTIVEGTTGVFFEAPEAKLLRVAMDECEDRVWSSELLAAHAESFSEERFAARLRAIVAEQASRAS